MHPNYQYLLSTISRVAYALVVFVKRSLRHKSTLFKVAAFALIYAITGIATLSFLSVDYQLLNMWVSTGLAVAVLLIGGIKYWPGIFMGTVLAGLWSDNTPGMLLGVGIGNTLGALAAAGYLIHGYHTKLRMQTFRDYFHIAIAGVVCAATSGTLGTLTRWLFSPETTPNLLYDFIHWWQGDLIGVLVITVSVLVWKAPPKMAYSHALLSEVLFFVAMTILAAFAIFSDGASGWLESYLMFAFVAWGGVRFQMHGALFVIAVCTFLGIAYLVEGTVLSGDLQPIHGLANFWMFLMALSAIGTVLALSIQEKQQLENAAITRSEVLQKLYQGATLSEVLDFALQLIERDNPDFRCCAVVFNDCDSTIEHISAPALKKHACDPSLRIIAQQGLAGCASQRLTVADVTCEHDWSPHLKIAKQFRIRAGYSTPIIGKSGKQLGAFSIYKKYAGTPAGIERRLVGRIATLMALVIEQNRLSEDQQLASLIFGNSSEAMTVTDANGLILAVNPAFTAVTGYEFSEVKGQKTSILSSDLQDRSFYQKMWHSLSETGAWQGEIWNKKKSGELYPEWLTINTVYNNDGLPHRRVALFSDLSAQKESEKLIWQQANLDALTSLPNRTMFQDLLTSTMCEADFSGLPMAL
ncbi:MAG: MASE1 domain-containing protein, partial [Oceanospirillaceae bacterium]|nr:MASE1 domain-containing protein [Oceanospirillaceae bacterium]